MDFSRAIYGAWKWRSHEYSKCIKSFILLVGELSYLGRQKKKFTRLTKINCGEFSIFYGPLHITLSLWNFQVPNPTCGGSACSFNFTYGTSSVAAGLVQDTVTLATDPVPGYTFGCVQKATGSSIPTQGLLGLGRGPLSLLAQTHHLYQSTFSYCLPSFKTLNFSGSLRLGPVAQPKRIKFTPLLKNPRRSSLYYVNLVAVRVGRRIVDIPPEALAFNPTTGAGTIFDSGMHNKYKSFNFLYNYNRNQ